MKRFWSGISELRSERRGSVRNPENETAIARQVKGGPDLSFKLYFKKTPDASSQWVAMVRRH